jgi:hypothetical protein
MMSKVMQCMILIVVILALNGLVSLAGFHLVRKRLSGPRQERLLLGLAIATGVFAQFLVTVLVVSAVTFTAAFRWIPAVIMMIVYLVALIVVLGPLMHAFRKARLADEADKQGAESHRQIQTIAAKRGSA